MTRRTAALLALHGLVMIFLGCVAGASYGAAIVNNLGTEAERAWKLAHMEGVQNGILLLALAGGSVWMTLGRAGENTVLWAAVLAGYGNTLGAMIGAATGYRGLAPEGPAANWVVFGAFMFGMWGVLVAVPVAAVGAWKRLREPDAPQ